MRYWGTESRVSDSGRRRKTQSSNRRSPRGGRDAAVTTRRKDAPAPTRSKVAGGGSVQPFLRKVYRHRPVISGPVQRVLLLLVLAGILYAFVIGDSGAIRIAILRHQRAQADQDIAELRHNAALLETEIERLKNDASYIEKIGRERFGYVRPDEQVFKIVPPAEGEK